MKKAMTGFLLLAVLALTFASPVSGKKTKKKISGATLFAEHCAKCHAGGANLVKPSKPVAGSNHLSTLAVFKAYLSNPPGHMPHYELVVNNQELLQSLYDYCKQLKVKPVKQAFLSVDSVSNSA